MFAEVHRHVQRDGVVWVNLGDTANAYQANRGAGGAISSRRAVARPVHGKGLTSASHANKTFLAVPQRFTVAMVDAGWTLRADVAWIARRIPDTGRDRPARTSERVLMFTKHDRAKLRLRSDVPEAWSSDVWYAPTSKGASTHPARFSLTLASGCLSWVSPSVLGPVLDPFCGSGTVGDAAAEVGRDFIGIDLVDWTKTPERGQP